MNERHDTGRKPSPEDVRRTVNTVKAMNAPFSDIEWRITAGVIGISAFFFVSAFISVLTLNAVVQNHAVVTARLDRLDRLAAIAVLDSARVDSLMIAHDYTWPKRGRR